MVSNTVWISHLIFYSFAAIRVMVRRSRAPNSSLNVNDIFFIVHPRKRTHGSLENHPLNQRFKSSEPKPLHDLGANRPLVCLLVICSKIPLKMNGWFTKKKYPLNQKVPSIWTIHLHDFGGSKPPIFGVSTLPFFWCSQGAAAAALYFKKEKATRKTP